MTDLSRQLAEWAAAEAAAERSRERWLRQQAEESATLAGVFVDMAERGSPVAVDLRGGAGTRGGAVTSVGADFAVIDDWFVPFAAVAAVRGERVSGDRAVQAPGLTFVGALARLAEDRVRVSVTLDGGNVVTGELRAAGDDVVTLTSAWVATDAIRALRLA